MWPRGIAMARSFARRPFLCVGLSEVLAVAIVRDGRPPEFLVPLMSLLSIPFLAVRSFYLGPDAPPNALDVVLTAPLGLLFYGALDWMATRLWRRAFRRRGAD